MNTIRKINVYAIFRDIMGYFVTSCGITLLYFFFNDNNIFSLENVKIIVLPLFLFLLTLKVFTVIYDLCTGNKNNWFLSETVCEQAMGKAVCIFPKEEKPLEEYEKRTIVHESGHALAAYLYNISSFSVHVSGDNPHLAYTQNNMTAEGLRTSILIDYAGAAAEEIRFDKFGYGCLCSDESDFVKAVERIRAYIVMTNESMSKTFLDRELSDKIIKLSNEFYAEVKELLQNNTDKLDIIAAELAKRETMGRDDIEKILIKNSKQEKDQ